jgi:ABC-type Fe3+ transport system permease subunit
VPVVSKSSNGVARKDEEEISLLDNSVYARLDAEAISDTSSSEVAPTPPAEPAAVQHDDSYVKRVSNTMLVASVATTLSFVIATVGIYGDH